MYYFIPFLFALLFPISSWAACSGYPAGVAGTDWIEVLSGEFSAGQKDHMINLNGANGIAGMMTYDATDNTLKLCDGTNWIVLGGSAGSQWNDNGSDIYFNSGNVGIGTTSPDFQLEITDPTGSPAAYVTADGDYFPDIGLRRINGTTKTNQEWIHRIGSGGNFLLHDKTNNLYPITVEANAAADMLYLDATGNVGIGTTGPGQKLTVAGTIESTTGGFKFPDGSTQTTAVTVGGIPTKTTAQRDAMSPTAGSVIYNSTTARFEGHNGTSWHAFNWHTLGLSGSTGGTIVSNGAYQYHVFTSSGTYTPSADGVVEVLVVAGGGGGGGAIYSPEYAVNESVGITVTVGAGGAGGLNTAVGSNGANSSFSALTATGGGGGANYSTSAGNSGGSGGGGAGLTYTSGAAGISGQGNAGGNG